MTSILSEVWKQITPDTSVNLRDGVKRLVYAQPAARIVASHPKKSDLIFHFGLSFRQRDTNKL